MRADRVTLNSPISTTSAFTRVSFRQAYASTPIVLVLPGDDNAEPAALRVVNVDPTGFDVQYFEPPGNDGGTIGGEISYIAITPGTYLLPDGTVVEAGAVSLSNHQGRNVPGASWSNLAFASTFASTAGLLVTLQSNNNGTLTPGTTATPWMTVVTRNVTTNGAEIALERSETSVGTIAAAETVGYLALSSGNVGNFVDNAANAVRVETIRGANNVPGWDNACRSIAFVGAYTDPVAVATKSTRNGADGGWLRRCDLSGSAIEVTVDEDQSADSERAHTNEIASVVVFSAPFDGALPGGRWEADRVTVASSGATTLNFTTVNFPVAMNGVPVVMTQPTQEDPAPAAIRIRNVTAAGFQIAAVEPPSGGGHDAMTLDYLAVVPGAHRLADGTLFEAGFLATTTVQHGGGVSGPTGWETINFTHSYTSAPAFVAQLQTTSNNEPNPDPAVAFVPWLTTAVENLTSGSVQVALERSESGSGSVTSAERIGYVAFTAGRHATLTDTIGQSVTYDTRVAGGAIQGFDNGCYAVGFTAPFSAVPLAIGHATTRNGNNGGWARRCALSATALSQHFDEDQENDAERSHIAESVAQLAFAQAFAWDPFADVVLVATLATVDDGISATEAKSIPGAIIDNTVQATNQGAGAADPDSVVLTFPIEPQTELFVGDLDGAGNPAVFTDGTPPNVSGLGWATPATQIAFSDDNGMTFDYVPPPAAEFDPNVTHLRLEPTGVFAGATVTSTPEFTVRYRFRVR